MNPSSIIGRPKNLDALIGQAKNVKLIRGLQKKRSPKAWMFVGATGSGKTTIAQIIALSLQCAHQTKFGRPCKICRRNMSNMPIFEIDCGTVTGVDDIKKYIRSSEYELLGQGKKKVYILDECQMLSKHAQSALLKPTEAVDRNTVWIFCTTDPEQMRNTIRSRCKIVTLKPFNRDEIYIAVKRLLEKDDSELSADDLTDALVENSVTSGRLVAQAVDSYLAGQSAEDAAEIDAVSVVKGKTLCKAVTKGDWEATRVLLRKADKTSARALRGAVIGYLRSVLLDSSEYDDRTKAVAGAITRLSYVSTAEDVNQIGALSAELYSLCETFSNYSL